MRSMAYQSGLWTYVEPASISPTWVHFDKRRGAPACATGGFPALRQGSVGNYVLVLQDSLNRTGHGAGGLDGVFGPATANAVKSFQKSKGLAADGTAGCMTWSYLMEQVVPRSAFLEPVD